MARKRPPASPEQKVLDYRYDDEKRKNIPPAGLAAEGTPLRGFDSFRKQKAGR